MPLPRRLSRWTLAIPVSALLLFTLTACSSDDSGDATDDSAASDSGDTGSGSATGDDSAAGDDEAEANCGAGPIRMGYSAWPGWFPWAVAKDAGIFEEVGVEVELEYFTDYIASLDAMASGGLDANTQTLNDTLVPVSTGSDQRIVVVNDNSAGNDAIIVDESITSIEDLEGATIAAEQGVVDHFLLLQGLDTVGLTQDDIDFRPVLTADAAAAFAGGEFDGVGVFAPFTTTALEREGSHVLFDSSDFPGTIPDHLVVSGDLVDSCPEAVQALVDAWYITIDHISDNPEESVAIMAELAGVTPEEYASYEEGTRIFTAEEALAAFEGTEAPEGLVPMAEIINDFLIDAELMEEPAPLDDIFDASFTADYIERNGG